jgi:hypothetical protein
MADFQCTWKASTLQEIRCYEGLERLLFSRPAATPRGATGAGDYSMARDPTLER